VVDFWFNSSSGTDINSKIAEVFQENLERIGVTLRLNSVDWGPYLDKCNRCEPSLLRMAGVPEGVRAGWWMNVFVFHPLINQIKPGGGLLIGEVLILGVFAMQYALLVLALVASRRQLRKARNHAPN
jgi:hypothetical protein